MSASWTMPTLRDALLADRQAGIPLATPEHAVAARYVVRHGEADNPLVRCGCGRRTSADMLADVRDLPVGHPVRPDATVEFLCDGCQEANFARGTIARDAFLRALGAPSAVVDRERLHELRRQAARSDAGRAALDAALTLLAAEEQPL